MPRIQVQLPKSFSFATDIQIYISHVNQGGHLDNAQLLTLVSEARVRFFKSMGYTEGNVAGHPIVVGDIVAQYKSEGFHGETMRVSMVPQDFNKYGFDLMSLMACLDTHREVARGKIGIVFIDRATRKVAAVPDEFKSKAALRYTSTFDLDSGGKNA
jgi:acyl-CoA thioesterase FadM